MFSGVTFLLLVLMATSVVIWGMYLIHSRTALSSGDIRGLEEVSEAQVIRYAVKAGGRLSIASLCMKADISTEQAQEKLEKLQEKGVFEMYVNESGTVYYELIDKDLLKK